MRGSWLIGGGFLGCVGKKESLRRAGAEPLHPLSFMGGAYFTRCVPAAFLRSINESDSDRQQIYVYIVKSTMLRIYRVPEYIL